MTQKAFFIKEL